MERKIRVNDPQSQENFSYYSGTDFSALCLKSFYKFFYCSIPFLMVLSTVNKWADEIGFVQLLDCFANSYFIK